MQEPLKGFVWAMVDEMGIPYARMLQFVESNGGGAVKTIQAFSRVAPGHFQDPEVAKCIASKRHVVFQHLCVAQNWSWMQKNALTRSDVSRVTYTEWSVFSGGDPFVLLRHDVPLEALIDLKSSAPAKRWGIVVSLLAKRQRVDESYVRREFAQYRQAFSRDFLAYDPSAGTLPEHTMWTEELEPESYHAAYTRLTKLGYGEYAAFQRLLNGLEEVSGGVFCHAESARAEREVPGMVAALVARGGHTFSDGHGFPQSPAT